MVRAGCKWRVPVSTCPLVGLAVPDREKGLTDGGRETDLEDGEKKPGDDHNVSKLGENGEAVFHSKGTGGVAYLETKLGDHGGRRQDGGSPTFITSCNTTREEQGRWLFQTCTFA